MPTANFFILIPTYEKKERESFRSRQNLIAVNLLSATFGVTMCSDTMTHPQFAPIDSPEHYFPARFSWAKTAFSPRPISPL
jgi:hypothetical protein